MKLLKNRRIFDQINAEQWVGVLVRDLGCELSDTLKKRVEKNVEVLTLLTYDFRDSPFQKCGPEIKDPAQKMMENKARQRG